MLAQVPGESNGKNQYVGGVWRQISKCLVFLDCQVLFYFDSDCVTLCGCGWLLLFFFSVSFFSWLQNVADIFMLYIYIFNLIHIFW